MKRIELVYRFILAAVEKKKRRMTQREIADALNVSLSTVNHALIPLRKMNAVRVKRRCFEAVDARKILYYWASIRNLGKDVVYATRVEASVSEIEKRMPPTAVFTAYSAYKFIFKDVPADYSEVYVYCNDLKEIRKRFPSNKNVPNLFVLKRESDKLTLSQLFVDLWNLREWYAKDFLEALEERLDGILA